MTAHAWGQLRKSWKLPLTPVLLWQSLVAGPLFSILNSCQTSLTAKQRQTASLAGPLVVLGYWRSGTTLLHNYLSLDKRFGFPSTYACMHPSHFVLTQAAALARRPVAVHRPMDDVPVYPSSPQEDEFGLLALGARSPYEALMVPCHLAEALALSDPRDLPADEERHWRDTFESFLRGISIVEGNRPLVLKSPPHGYRVATLRQLLPDARFILIVRSPDIVYESTVRMWRSLFGLYAMGAIPPEDDTRRVVLADRPRFETKLVEGLSGLPQERLSLIHYEELVRDPINVIGLLYEKLCLGGFSDVEKAIRVELTGRGQYTARNAMPPDYWMRQVQVQWRSVFEKYNYELGSSD
jgi:hypothetical protein